jgi:hypothetical protein
MAKFVVKLGGSLLIVNIDQTDSTATSVPL